MDETNKNNLISGIYEILNCKWCEGNGYLIEEEIIICSNCNGSGKKF